MQQPLDFATSGKRNPFKEIRPTPVILKIPRKQTDIRQLAIFWVAFLSACFGIGALAAVVTWWMS